jgi:Gram-negative bacterial TonB protein C-terminal
MRKILLILLIFVLCNLAFGQNNKSERTLKLGIINGQASFLPKPVYTQEAKDFCACGKVEVEVLVDEKGNVIQAKAISGDELLRESSVEAAKKAKFKHSEFNSKVRGIIVYNYDSFAPKCIVTNRIVNDRAIYLPKPIVKNIVHPMHLKLQKDEIVKVEIILDRQGKVISARAISGHTMLRSVCEKAALKAKFSEINDVPLIRIKTYLAYRIKPSSEVQTNF